jgi:phosphoribosylaminoimidazole-succinocarboxamide synthase
VSAFDVVMAEPVPHKGAVLTQLTAWWLRHLEPDVEHHMLASTADDIVAAVPSLAPHAELLRGRAMLCRRANVFPVECVVRGYLFGSAWSEYKKQGTVNGEPLPSGMVNAERLPEPIFTPTTKADEGHDAALTVEEGYDLVGRARYEELRELSIAIYRFGSLTASMRGIILADTKLEFGEADGKLLLIDEVLTPDSSRFWPAGEYEPGTSPPSFDKQFVRQYLLETGWDGAPPAPPLPEAVVEGTRSRYVEAYERLTESSFDEWYGPDE